MADTVRALCPVIVNAAAHTAVDKAESEPAARACSTPPPPACAGRGGRAPNGAWLVHYSTDYVFDGSGDRPWTEDDATPARSRSTAPPSWRVSSSSSKRAAST